MLYYYLFDEEQRNEADVYAPVIENLVNLTSSPLIREYVEYFNFQACPGFPRFNFGFKEIDM